MGDMRPSGGVVICDLDGVVWLAHRPIPGSVEAIASMRAIGQRVLFVTNNSAALIATQEGALAAIGIEATGDVLTSAAAAAQLVEPGERALVCGGEGIREALLTRGVVLVEHAADAPERVDVVVVGLHRTFDYESLASASSAVRAGARLIGTNDDPTYPTPNGLIPGGGAILAAVATASGVAPIIAGKPYAPMADLVRSVIGANRVQRAIVVGDRPETDGRLAIALGCRFALVHTGVTSPDAVIEPAPDLRVDDLAAVASTLVSAAEARR